MGPTSDWRILLMARRTKRSLTLEVSKGWFEDRSKRESSSGIDDSLEAIVEE